jgi:hypothetical protein
MFGGSPAPEPGMPEQHTFFDPLARLFGRQVADVKQDFEVRSQQLAQVLEGLRHEVSGFELDEISIELGFSASGHLVFIAEAGINATVSVTYRRRSSGQ